MVIIYYNATIIYHNIQSYYNILRNMPPFTKEMTLAEALHFGGFCLMPCARGQAVSHVYGEKATSGTGEYYGIFL